MYKPNWHFHISQIYQINGLQKNEYDLNDKFINDKKLDSVSD